jgi:peptidoglycan LD-endopeptidase LytH
MATHFDSRAAFRLEVMRSRFVLPVLILLVGVAVITGVPGILNTWWLRLEFLNRLRSLPALISVGVPVVGVRKSQIVDTWGAARGAGRKHEGVDIFAPTGTPVLSVSDGLVVRVGEDPLGGQIVTVWGAGNRRYYAHFSRFGPFKTGEIVREGDLIGFVGQTGNARTTPPHLHFGVYTPDGAINPFPILGPKPVLPRLPLEN